MYGLAIKSIWRNQGLVRVGIITVDPYEFNGIFPPAEILSLVFQENCYKFSSYLKMLHYSYTGDSLVVLMSFGSSLVSAASFSNSISSGGGEWSRYLY